MPVRYKDAAIEGEYRLDVIVENRLVTEFKVGLLVNFNVAILRHGLRRLESTNSC